MYAPGWHFWGETSRLMICPDAVIAMDYESAPDDLEILEVLNFHVDDSGISSSLSWTVLKGISDFLQGTALIDVIQALGWMIVIKLSLIMTSTGILWSEGLVYCLAIHFFLKIRTWTVAGNDPAVRCKIKLWHVWIWDALVDPSISLKMDMRKDIPTFAALKFGEARILFQSQDGCELYFKLLDCFLPARGTLHVDYTAITPKEIGCEFEQFWSKMWLRDIRAERFELTSWESFDELLQDVDLPVIPEIAYPIDDINLWMHLVKSLPSAKAVGLCGWSNDELKA